MQAVSKSGTVTVLIQLGCEGSLPPAVLSMSPAPPGSDMRTVIISDPAQLENAVLDLDGRVERHNRRAEYSWRRFTVFRWREDIFGAGASALPLGDDGELDIQLLATMDRGGRENYGTLHYLRGCCSD